jgi:hypothetical protein
VEQAAAEFGLVEILERRRCNTSAHQQRNDPRAQSNLPLSHNAVHVGGYTLVLNSMQGPRISQAVSREAKREDSPDAVQRTVSTQGGGLSQPCSIESRETPRG